jgi:hypothetical protein
MGWASNGVLASNVFAITCLGQFNLSTSNGGVVPTFGQRFKVASANGERVYVKFFV